LGTTFDDDRGHGEEDDEQAYERKADDPPSFSVAHVHADAPARAAAHSLGM
jgi:hypothetical protein